MSITRDQPAELLRAYVAALRARDLDAIERLAGAHCLFEIPFVKPNRLVGAREVHSAHREIFAALEAIDIRIEAVAENADHAIVEATIAVTRDGSTTAALALGIVAATGDSGPRISLYCDTRYLRPWVDQAIL